MRTDSGPNALSRRWHPAFATSARPFFCAGDQGSRGSVIVKTLFLFVIIGWASLHGIAASQDPEPHEVVSPPATIEEARSRAMLLHETIVGMLQVVHRDFFEEDESKAIPSASFEDVFHELSDQFQVKIRWLIVDTDVVNIDHQAQDDFESDAVKSLAKGARQFARVEGKTYRFAGTVRLASQCLKCHVKQRTSTEDRRAGLLISMELR